MRLSVAMCTYNGEKYIREQLMSIHNQTLSIDEIVICDDCSEDNTVIIIEDLIQQYNLPIQLQVNAWNHGYRKNFEQAICRCSGDIIFLSDQDDIWMPNKVETVINYFNHNPDKEFVFTNATLVNAVGINSFKQTLFDIVLLDRATLDLFDKGYHLEILSIYCRVTGATCALRASFMPYCIPFSNVIVHDEMIAMTSAFQNKIGYINQCLIKYRQHGGQTVGLKIAMKNPGEKWEYTSNLMMWYEALIEPNDDKTRERLRFIYRRFWTLRSTWALFKIIRMKLTGYYKKYYTNDNTVFFWDIRTIFLRIWKKIKSIKDLRVIIADKN